MEISCQIVDRVQVVALRGELEGKAAPEVQDQILGLAVAGASMLLDMRQVSYISSAGLRTLLLLYRQLNSHQGRLALVGLSDQVRDTMETTGFLNHFATYDQLEEGLRALRREPETT